MSSINVLIVGGGTGGHIIPGIALYEEFKRRGIRARLLVGKRDKKYSPLKVVDEKDLFFYGAPSVTRNIFIFLLFVQKFIIAVYDAIVILRRLKINTVIGMGGFVSAPTLVASAILKIPIFLCEQNTVPGRVTIFFSRFAIKIFTTFDVTKESFKKGEVRSRVLYLGNPIRKSIMTDIGKESAKDYFYLKHCKRVILVIGGSQGALQINELFLDIKKRYSDDLKDVGIIWATGEYSYKKYNDVFHEMSGNGSIYISPFFDNVGLAYRASDIALSRSGAGVIMEFAAVGLPSILIPYPYASSDHQDKNADVFDKAGAAIKIERKDNLPEKVGQMLISLLNNPSLLGRMSENARLISKADAAQSIVDSVVCYMYSYSGMKNSL